MYVGLQYQRLMESRIEVLGNVITNALELFINVSIKNWVGAYFQLIFFVLKYVFQSNG
jgi:hypothetical protein